MSRKTDDLLPTISIPAVPQQVFPPSAWAKLAELMVGQDVIVLPGNRAALEHEGVDRKGEAKHRKASALALVEHWLSMGFKLSKRDALELCDLDPITHAWLHQNITPALKARLGGHVRMTPMYPNFPKEVMEMDTAELVYNAIMHYAGDYFDVRVLPDIEAKKRKPLPKGEGQERALRVVDMAGLRETLSDLVRMNTVWTPTQALMAKHALPLLLHWDLVGPDTALPQRENQAHLMGAWLELLKNGKTAVLAWPANRISTTDILRGMVAYSGGDPSLASSSEKVPFAKLSRGMRRVVMQALERAVAETSNPVSDLHGQRQAWLRLAEKLHVGEWEKMPKAREAIAALRNQPAPVSWNGELDAVLAKPASHKTIGQVAGMFRANPGLAARALRRCLAWAAGKETDLIEAFEGVAERVDTPVLLALEATMRAEAIKPKRARVMLPKGAAAWRYRVDAQAHPVDKDACVQAAQVCETALLARFSQLEPLGKVFIEDGLDGVIVPKGLRSASDSVGVVARGSKLPVGQDAKIIRLFLWWKDTNEGRVDVDLSAVGVGENFQQTETCNYHALKEPGMVHSGDLTSAPNGAAEFIDINMAKLSKATRYVVLTANVYHGPGFSQLPECFVGWQERESGKGQRGEIQELKTVVEKFQVTASTKGFLGAVFDVKERKLMWLDLPVNTRSYQPIHDSRGNVQAAVEDFQLYAFSQPTVGHLVDLHVAARGGERVDNAKDADVVFSLTTRLAKPGQVVIAATQPQTVASALMVGPAREKVATPAAAQISPEAAGDVIPVNLKTPAKAARKPRR